MKVTNKRIYVDGYGNEKLLETMSDDHIINVLAKVSHRQMCLNAIGGDSIAVGKAIAECDATVDALLGELAEREMS